MIGARDGNLRAVGVTGRCFSSDCWCDDAVLTRKAARVAEFLSRRDVDFLLYEWLDVVEVTKRDHVAEHSRDTFDAVLDLSTVIAAKCFAPHDKKGDQSIRWWGPMARSC